VEEEVAGAADAAGAAEVVKMKKVNVEKRGNATIYTVKDGLDLTPDNVRGIYDQVTDDIVKSYIRRLEGSELEDMIEKCAKPEFVLTSDKEGLLKALSVSKSAIRDEYIGFEKKYGEIEDSITVDPSCISNIYYGLKSLKYGRRVRALDMLEVGDYGKRVVE